MKNLDITNLQERFKENAASLFLVIGVSLLVVCLCFLSFLSISLKLKTILRTCFEYI